MNTLNNIVLEENINIKYSEMDFDKSLKPYSLLNYFQDIASESAERLGFGYSFVRERNLMWVLLKYRIEFDEYPVDIFKARLTTQPRGYNRLFAYRNFELYAGEKRLARASSIWSLVNMSNKSISMVENVIQNPYMPKFQANDTDLKFGKIPQISKIDLQKEFEVRYNDVDVNLHANNGNYIVWAFEPLSYEFKANHKLKTIDMIFKKELKYGEKLISQVEFIDEKTTLHELKHAETNEDLCLLRCEWV